ncbi:MAG TPA: CcmD family protein [Vicinamibacterales bacterium]|jgi:CcmD family protein|nr:CcmD family protein [Vicinamibacterales bacterium]
MVKRTETRRGAVLSVLLAVFIGISVSAQQPQPQPQPQPAPPAATDEFVPISQLPPQDQLPAAPLLISAYAFVWVALFGYLLSVGRRLTKVQGEVQRLESDIAKGTRT